MAKFEIYCDTGLIGYANSIQPFNTPGGHALMLKKFTWNFKSAPIVPSEPFKEPETSSAEERNPLRYRLPNLDKQRDTLIVIEGGKEIRKKVGQGPGELFKANYFRCPTCGQSAVISIEGQIVIRMLDGDQEILKSGTAIDTEKYDFNLYRNREDLTVVQIVADDSLQGFCPMCLENNVVLKWIHAWEEPLAYTEFEHPCCMCGYETVVLIREEDSEAIRKCESKFCAYEQILNRRSSENE